MFELKGVSFAHVSRDDGRRFQLQVDDAVIPQSGITAVIGPSGSGKTTLLSLLSGFARARVASGGALRFSGRDMVAQPRHAPGQVAFVFQAPMLLGASSGATNAIQGAMLTRPDTDRGRVLRLLDALDLRDDGGRLLSGRVADHSGGEAQRIAVLRALLSDAQAILCDEPTSSLDEKNAGEVLSAFRDWAHQGQRPVVWVTHDLHHSAEYADHFLFLRDGQVCHPPAELRADLETGDYARRLAALKALATTDGHNDGPPTTAPSVISRTEDPSPKQLESEESAPLRLPTRSRYLKWLARALSTATERGHRREAAVAGSLTPRSEADFTASLSGSPPQPRLGWLSGQIAAVLAYGRWGLALVFLATLLQVVAAFFLYSAAGTYYAQRLQDPAVARIGFEHVIESLARRGTEGGPTDLTPSVIRQMTDDLRGRVADRLAPADLNRILIHGRRHERTRLRFAAGACTRWVTFDTAILSPDDPLLNQIVLEPDVPDAGLAADLATGTRLSPALQTLRQRTGEGAIIIDAALARQMRESCGLGKDAPAIEWIHSDAHRPHALTLQVVAVAAQMPPVHPFTPQIIVFEPDLQAQMQTSDTVAPGSFRVANLYFPIEMFDLAEAFLLEKGYTTVTDSRAAVRTLRQMAGLAEVLPIVIVLINSLVTLVIVSIVINNVLELNKRVFTLFNAYGYRFRDILALILMHLLPAVLASILCVLFISAGVAWLLLSVLDQFGNPIQFATNALIQGVILQSLVILVIACATIGLWWRHAGRNLGSLLKE